MIHLGLVLAYPYLMRRIQPGLPPVSRTGPAPAPFGTRLLRIVELPSPAEEAEPPPPEPEPERAEPVVSRPRAPRVGEPTEAGADAPPEPSDLDGTAPLTAAERLRPGPKDPRLWAPLPEEIVGLSDAQRAQLELELRIGELSDSMVAVLEAARRATDWTYTDAEGRRWGISPGQLHLGDLTIPLPTFGVPPNSDAARRARIDDEISNQAGRAEAAEALRDRAAEIRRRRDADRGRSGSDSVRGGG